MTHRKVRVVKAPELSPRANALVNDLIVKLGLSYVEASRVCDEAGSFLQQVIDEYREKYGEEPPQ